MWKSTSVSGAKVETWRKIVISTQVIALMESNEAQRDASFAANRIFHESWVPVRRSKFYGAFVLSRRVDLHAIDATLARWRDDAGSPPLDGASARWRGDAGSPPLDGASAATSSAEK